MEYKARGNATRDVPATLLGRSLDALAELCCVLSTDGEVLAWNEQVVETTGYAETALASMTITDLFADDDRETVSTALDEIVTHEGSKTIEASLSTSEESPQQLPYRRLVERISAGCYAVDTDWTITYWNDVMARRKGVSPSAAIGETLWDLFPDVRDTAVSEAFRTAMAEQTHVDGEYYYPPGDYWVRLQIYPDDEGIAVISTDITEQKEDNRLP